MSLGFEPRCGRTALSLGWIAMVGLLVAVACARDMAYSTTLYGTVVDSNGAPVVNATVTWVGTNQVVHTGGAGLFSFVSNGENSNATVLSFAAGGFAPQYRNYRWTLTDVAVGEIQLQPVSLSQEVALPASPNDVATLSVTLGDAGARVAWGYQTLITPDGTPAQGNATVNLTYWHPQGDLSGIPGALIASDANGPYPLRTYGMLSVDIVQGGTPLEVAPGQTATLAFTTPANMLATMLNQTVPNLYWLDPNDGVWHQQAAAGDGNMVLDPNTGVFTTRVPHFSEWNMDGVYEYQNGGCVTGHVFNMCAPTQGAANANVTVWFLGLEQLATWYATTDNSGDYCINVGVGPYQGAASDPRGYPISYMVTSTADITQPGTMCDPLPQECRTCDPEYATWSYPPCNDCVIEKADEAGYVAPGQTSGPVYADCDPPTPEAYIQRCTFCPGTAPAQCANVNYDFDTGENTEAPSAAEDGGCWTLQTIGLQAPGCSCVPVGQACKAGSTCCPTSGTQNAVCGSGGTCVACTKTLGQTCDETQGCCESGAGAEALVCADNVCVPATDPSFTE